MARTKNTGKRKAEPSPPRGRRLVEESDEEPDDEDWPLMRPGLLAARAAEARARCNDQEGSSSSAVGQPESRSAAALAAHAREMQVQK